MAVDEKVIRLLAVDDHPVFRGGIAELIEGQADMVLIGEASNGREAIQHFRAHLSEITLMDLQMPEMNCVYRKYHRGRIVTESTTPRSIFWGRVSLRREAYNIVIWTRSNL
jgi:CheY-like chemotaxis protein